MRPLLILAFLASGATAGAAPPGESIARPPMGARLTFSNGHTMDGLLVSLDEGSVTVEVDGGTVSLPRKAVSRIVAGPNKHAEHRAREAETDPRDAAALWTLARWAAENGLPLSAEAAAERVLRLEPDHAAARAYLDHEKVRGAWLRGGAARRDLESRPEEADDRERWDEDLYTGNRDERRWGPQERPSFTWITLACCSAPAYRPADYLHRSFSGFQTGTPRAVPESGYRRYRAAISRRLKFPLPEFSHRRVMSFR
ncbi:MAG: hypothetical protein ABII00_10400 [Elusimicrobiota bacterium]